MRAVDGWGIKPLSDVADITMGQSPDSKFYSEEDVGLPFLQGCAEFGSKFPAPKLNCSQIKKVGKAGSLLFSVRAPVGKTNIADRDYIIGRGLAAIKASFIDANYLEQFIGYIEPQFRNASQGSTFEAINSKELSGWPIEFPCDPEEQTQIATILSTLDLAIEQTEAIIAKQQRIKTGLMQDLLTKGIDEHGVIRSEATHQFKDSPLGRIPVEWEVCAVGEICSSLVPGRDKPELDDGGIPWITISDLDGLYVTCSTSGLSLSKNSIKAANARLIPLRAVIMSCVGEFGIAAIANNEIVINQQLHAFVCSGSVLPEWLVFQIRSSASRIDQMATQTTIKYLNKSGCESIQIRLPSQKEQNQLVKLMLGVVATEEANRLQLSKMRKTKSGLMHDLLTGKVRVSIP